MINPVKQFYSKKSARRTTVTESTKGSDTKSSLRGTNGRPKPLPDLRSLPKPPAPKRLRLVLERCEAGQSSTFVVENHAYPGEAARHAALMDRERALFLQEIEHEELRRRALQTEGLAAERERNLHELEALLRARELLLDEREKRAAQNPVPMPQEAGPALEMLKNALDQREESLKQAQTALTEREEKVRQREKDILDADALIRLKEDLEQREKALQEAQNTLREREEFLENSENLLCEKGQMLVERETQLDQLEDELQTRLKSVAEPRAV